MRTKILLVADEAAGHVLATSIQEVLTELAVAFGHSFVIREEKIGSASQAAYGVSLTQETVDEAADCDAVLCLSAHREDHVALASGLHCSLACHVFALPSALAQSSRLKQEEAPAGLLMFPLGTDPTAFGHAVRGALALAQLYGQERLTQIPFTGALLKAWEGSNAASAVPPATNLHKATLPEALHALTQAPSHMGAVFAAPSSCEALDAVAVGLSGLPSACFHSVYWGEQPAMYASVVGQHSQDTVSPFGALFACVDMLRHVFHLTREADCLSSSIHNVVDAGWRTTDMQPGPLPRVGTDAICKLICEQIALAGQLMTK